jgi:PWI domain
VIVDAESQKYAADWRERRGDDETTVQFRIDSAKEILNSVLAALFNPMALEQDGDVIMLEGETAQDPNTGEIIPIGEPDDELAEIPADMRETVAKEIAAFRERSNRRDMEELRREEEREAQFTQRRKQQLASPPASAPSGPAGGANGIPLGPRARGIEGAPSGPRSQMPKDYKDAVRFVNGDEASIWNYVTQDEENDSETDDWELERRRREKKEREHEQRFNDNLRRWMTRERARASAVEREANRAKDEVENFEERKANMAKKLKSWNDDVEAVRTDKGADLYYADHAHWLRNRSTALNREARDDNQDRWAEEQEKALEREKEEKARGMADSFLREELGDTLRKTVPQEPSTFKFTMAGTAAPAAPVTAEKKRKTAFEAEGLLEDEEGAATTGADSKKRRELVRVHLDAITDTTHLTAEEREDAVKQLASQIPTDTEGLFKWEVAWDHITEDTIEDALQPFIEKKTMEILGVQEQMLVDTIIDHIRKKGAAQDLVGELEGVSLVSFSRDHDDLPDQLLILI